MKKIINGKKYDTETATEIACWSNERCGFEYCCETLYRKRTGEYFLHGSGGAMSKYAESCGQNTWCGGESIRPLSEENAKRFVESHFDGDKYEEIFGEVEE